MAWIRPFANCEELAESGHRGDGYADVLFEAVGVG